MGAVRTKNARNSEQAVSARCRTAVAAAVASAVLAACGSAPVQRPAPVDRAERPQRPARGAQTPPTPSPAPPRTSRGGGYYLDDGPGDSPPPDLDSIPDAVP